VIPFSLTRSKSSSNSSIEYNRAGLTKNQMSCFFIFSISVLSWNAFCCLFVPHTQTSSLPQTWRRTKRSFLVKNTCSCNTFFIYNIFNVWISINLNVSISKKLLLKCILINLCTYQQIGSHFRFFGFEFTNWRFGPKNSKRSYSIQLYDSMAWIKKKNIIFI
jgi:hypothetical protein